jgi:hypothetical protein
MGIRRVARSLTLSALAVFLGSPLEAQVLSGSYVGDGSLGRPISGLGFRPDVVIIKGNNAARAVIRTSTMTGDATKEFFGNSLQPGRIQSLDPNGFTLGMDPAVNSPGVSHFWIAFRAAAGELKVGSYSGNGTDNRNITGVGFQPDYVIVLPESAAACFQRSSAMIGDTSYNFELTNNVPDHIQALQADGFQVGASPDVNGGGTTYHYAAWKAVAGKMAVGSYTGDGVDNRNLGVGFRPEYVVLMDYVTRHITL